MSYLSSKPSWQQAFFQAKDVPLWENRNLVKIMFFIKHELKKTPSLTKENHLRLKNFFHQ